MKRTSFLAVVCVMALANIASADIFGTGSNQFTLDFVNIGHAGNAADTWIMTTDGTSGYGAVGYNYRIGKYEVTNAQWNAFAAAAGAPTGNPSTAYNLSAEYTNAQQPAQCVSWYEAAQFCNYLTSGNKSIGAYQLGTDGSITVDRAAAISNYGTVYVMPTEDEWYKAAYFKPNGTGYSLYSNGLNTIPAAGNGWNYGGIYTAPWNVGNGTQEQNSTYDMMGNVWEWNETLIGPGHRGRRGSSFRYIVTSANSSSERWNSHPDYESGSYGFRVASIPEPATMLLLGLGFFALRRRRA